MDIGEVLIDGWMVLIIIYAAWIIYRSFRAKRQVGPVVIRFQVGNYKHKHVMYMFTATIAVWLAGWIYTGEPLNVMILIWTPLFIGALNPVYLGEKGIKAGIAFMPRSEFARYEWIEKNNRRVIICLHWRTGGRPLRVVHTYRQGDEQATRQLLDRYLATTSPDSDDNKETLLHDPSIPL